MKTITKTLAFVLLGFGVNAQTDAQLVEWQANNPEKLIMSRANYELLTPQLQELIASTVVFKDEIGVGIFGIEDSSLGEATSNEFSENNFVKTWLSENQGVKIVTRSQYNNSRPEIQVLYDLPATMVLIGEVLTKQDILNY